MKIIHASGQSCNQFWQYSNFIADSIEKDEKFAIWIPDITIRHFPNLLNSKTIYFPLYSKFLIKIFGYKNYMKLISIGFGNKYQLQLLKILINIFPKLNFIIVNVGGVKSKFRTKHLNQIRFLFTPEKSITDEVKDVFLNERNQYDLIIGVHIRYGDYLTFKNGKYYYTLVQYQKVMKNISFLFPEKKILFFVACNEKIDISFFSKINCFSIPDSFSVKDLYGLSMCDYIIGPPSTFSAWASLFGDVKLYFIEDPEKNVKIDDFKKMEQVWL